MTGPTQILYEKSSPPSTLFHRNNPDAVARVVSLAYDEGMTQTFSLPETADGFMLGTMPERVRVTIDTTERIKRALNIFAARKGFSLTEAIEYLVANGIPNDLSLASGEVEESDPPKPVRGRPKKPK